MGGYSAVATVISNIASRFTTTNQQSKLKTFNNNNKAKFGSSAATLEAAEKTVEENFDWANKKLGAFTEYLANYKTSGSTSLSGFTALTLVLVAVMARLFQ